MLSPFFITDPVTVMIQPKDRIKLTIDPIR